MVRAILIDTNGHYSNFELESSNLNRKMPHVCKKGSVIENVYNISRIGSIGCIASKSERNGEENKMELPPPLDKDLFFGNILFFKRKEDELMDLTISQLHHVFKKKFGGSIELGDDSELSEDDSDLSSVGSFIVDSDQSLVYYSDDQEWADESDDESDDESLENSIIDDR